jgi:hypothetical protein
MQNGKSTLESVSSENGTAQAVNILPAGLTGWENSSQNRSRSLKQGEHNSISLDSKSVSVTLLSRCRMPLDVANGFSKNLMF